METDWVVQNPDFNTGGNDNYPKITVDLDGNVYFCYETAISTNQGQVSGGSRTGASGSDIVVVKLNGQDGSVIWTAQDPKFNTGVGDDFPTIAVDNLGSVYIAYSTAGGQVSGGSRTGVGLSDIIIARLNAVDGSVVWVRQSREFNTGVGDFGVSIAVDTTSVYFVYETSTIVQVSGGSKTGASTGTEIVVVRLSSSDGSIVWTSQDPRFNTGGTDNDPSIALDSAGNLFISYLTNAQVSGGSKTQSSDVAVAKLLCTDGSVVWVRQDRDFNTGTNDTFGAPDRKIVADTTGVYFCYYATGVIVSGGSKTGSTGSDIIIVKLDNATGSTVWTRQNREFNTGDVDDFPSIALDGVGGVYVAYEGTAQVSGGLFTGAPTTRSDITTFKLDCVSGNLEWTYQNRSLNTGGSSGADLYPSLAVDRSRNLYYCFHTSGQQVQGGTKSSTVSDIVVVKLLSPRSLGSLPCFTGDSEYNSVPVAFLTSVDTEHNGTVNVRGIQRFLANNVPVYTINGNSGDVCKVTGKTLFRTIGSGIQNEPVETSIGLAQTTFSGEFIFVELEGKDTRYFVPWRTGGDQFSVEMHGRLRPLAFLPRNPNF